MIASAWCKASTIKNCWKKQTSIVYIKDNNKDNIATDNDSEDEAICV